MWMLDGWERRQGEESTSTSEEVLNIGAILSSKRDCVDQ